MIKFCSTHGEDKNPTHLPETRFLQLRHTSLVTINGSRLWRGNSYVIIKSSVTTSIIIDWTSRILESFRKNQKPPYHLHRLITIRNQYKTSKTLLKDFPYQKSVAYDIFVSDVSWSFFRPTSYFSVPKTRETTLGLESRRSMDSPVSSI